ncbi:DNA sulfur modification protein DndB [Azospirillum tabaci]|uniref:DNA sulfur modification protein DndB n=1 Tax=Azospirillum tabaci TaxID=2752310 RepID=UPI001660B957|nr:DNA sulfur modification protein DndB [Azospirillum tabaci]
MSYNFSVQKFPLFGTYGEFSVGSGSSQIRAQYVLTKIRPGLQGLWENQLASQMKPWREVFKIEELSFEELIQRDLDDSRVAHDLIPYLLGETGHNARFFPPILAVMVPKRSDRSGISPYYPAPSQNGARISFGDLFDFEQVEINGTVTPLGVINYNPQRTAMVIVDGQHRAMAVLALHRQLNKNWEADPFAPYYSHIQVTPEAVAHVELPVCLMFFPDLHDGNTALEKGRIDLTTVSREIFTVVNKQAKEVSKSRELLLDDEDFAAFMMRQTLSHFKDRSVESVQSARIYSFAFGDSEADNGSQVMSGQLEYCSAVAIHKMHAATGFGLPGCYNITKPDDVTDGRKVRNPARPIEVLQGSGSTKLQSLSRRSAKNHSPADVRAVVESIGALTDIIMLPMFDQLRPFAVHNEAMQELKTALEDPTAMADSVQSKCRTLLFEGSGTKHVFEEHADRLKERSKDLLEQGMDLPAHLVSQISYCDAVTRALQAREEQVRKDRAFFLFNIDRNGFAANRDKATVEAEIKLVRGRAKAIFDTVSTQAFQIGYLMAALSLVELMLPDTGGTYDERLEATRFASKLLVEGVNSFFAVTATKHKTLTGYVIESRAKAFEAAEPGFRGLLAATNVRELNEKQWEFFRYVIFEILHSRLANGTVQAVLADPQWQSQAARYRAILPQLLDDLEELRQRYFDAAVRTAQGAADFKQEVELKKMQAKSQNKSDVEIKTIEEEALLEKMSVTLDICRNHLKASLGRVESRKQILKRLVPADDTAGFEERDDIEAGEDFDAGASDAGDPSGAGNGIDPKSTPPFI